MSNAIAHRRIRESQPANTVTPFIMIQEKALTRRSDVWAILALLAILFGIRAVARASDRAISADDREVFALAQVEPEPHLLLQLLQERIALGLDPTRLSKAVENLGAPRFRTRVHAEAVLLRAGPVAIPFLARGVRDSDLERARLAQGCVANIRRHSGPRLTDAIVRLLATHRPRGTASVLLSYLPFAEDTEVSETILQSLLSVAMNNGKANVVVVLAVKDPQASRRAAAAFLLGYATDLDQQKLLRSLLVDPSPEVRWKAAEAVLKTGDTVAIPVLIALLLDASPFTAWQVERTLLLIAGRTAPRVSLHMTERGRRDCHASWVRWWKMHSTSREFLLSSRTVLSPLFLTLAPKDGCIVAFGPDYKETWRICDCDGPIDAELLPSGRVLVAENYAQRVTERDTGGRIVWHYDTTSLPAGCWREPDGNTLIATQWELISLTPELKKNWSLRLPSGLWAARRLRGGNFAILACDNRIVTFTSGGEQVDELSLPLDIPKWAGLSVLPNGNYLIGTDSRIVEFSPTGTIVSDKRSPIDTVSVDRLPNGNSLVCDRKQRRLVELDQLNQLVRRYPLSDSPFRVRVCR